MVHQLIPISSSSTRFQLSWFVDDDAAEDDYDVAEIAAVWDVTTLQDMQLIERAQDGLLSRRYSPGPLSAKHEPYIRSSLNVYLAMTAGDTTVARLLERAG